MSSKNEVKLPPVGYSNMLIDITGDEDGLIFKLQEALLHTSIQNRPLYKF
jgi:hypothetical protein